MNRAGFFKAIAGGFAAVAGFKPIAKACDIGYTIIHFGKKRELAKQWTSEPFKVKDYKFKKGHFRKLHEYKK